MAHQRLGWFIATLALTVLSALQPLSVAAQDQQVEQARCVVLGPLAVSGYVGFLEKVAAGERSAAASRAASAVDLIDLYDRLGCATDQLTQALECLSARLIDPESRALTSEQVQRCMQGAGMTTR